MQTVTQTGDRTAAERKRRQRERQRAAANTRAPLLFERADWQLFLRPETLPQKAGCEPEQINRIVLKEIVDNALDTGSDEVTIEQIPGGWRVKDHDNPLQLFDNESDARNGKLVLQKYSKICRLDEGYDGLDRDPISYFP